MIFPNLISDTLCTVDTSNRSCYARVLTDTRYFSAFAAFVSGTVCIGATKYYSTCNYMMVLLHTFLYTYVIAFNVAIIIHRIMDLVRM